MKQNIQNIIAEFIPIVLIFLFLYTNKQFLLFSKTILGKVISILIIVFYAFINKYIGLFACIVVILFYRYGYKESFDFIEYDTNDLDVEVIDDPIYLDINSNKSKDVKVKVKVLKENDDIIIEDGDEIFRREFRKENCKNGYLKNKGMNVKIEMAEHVFPEMKYTNVVCNPCDENCDFTQGSGNLLRGTKVPPETPSFSGNLRFP